MARSLSLKMNDTAPLAAAKLTVDLSAITSNWRALRNVSGDAGAAIKANAYGLGAQEVVKSLYDAGCRDFFVANWLEASQLINIVPSNCISILNGISQDDVHYAASHDFIPVLNSPFQINLWREYGNGKKCHIMLDSGINRLGIMPSQCDAILVDGLNVDALLSHLASADEDSPYNEIQRKEFDSMAQSIVHERKSLANSAGIMLGKDYHYDFTRPGLSLYGGIARGEMMEFIKPVISIKARVLQVRIAEAGSPIGYNGLYICPEDMPVATAAIGYADGYSRTLSGAVYVDKMSVKLPIIGRISMDLITIDARNYGDLAEGDWVNIDYDLLALSKLSNISQYELLTNLGNRYDLQYINYS